MSEVSPEPTNRDEQLVKTYLQLAGVEPRSEPDLAQAYIDDGNGMRNILAERSQLREPSELDSAITSTREAYMDVVLTRPTIFNRLARKEKLQVTEKEYETAVISKLVAYTNGDGTPKSALALGQLPGIIRKATFNNEPLALRDLAANHLHLSMDTLLQEHATRRQIIDKRNEGTPLARLRNNRELHIGVAAVIFFAALSPEVITVPAPDEVLLADIALALKIGTAVVFGIDGPEVIRLWYLDRVHNKQTKKLTEQLADNQEETDLALRLTYGSPHYGSSVGLQTHSARSGTDNSEENTKMLVATNAQIDNMHGDPGGRPYTGQQAIGYAARFLIERRDRLDAIMEESDPSQRENLFVGLVQEVLQEDLDRMKKGLTITRLRKAVMRTIAIGISPFISNDLNVVSSAVSTASDIADDTISGPEKKNTQHEA
jgi:hypothetical protein